MVRLCVQVLGLFIGSTQLVMAVSINEVAWMGSTANANHEWIELYNSSNDVVSLDGFSLTDGANLNIQLSGSLNSSAYAVLERTSDESAPGNAWLIYSGALVNTGATLTLRDGNGVIVDQVTGGTNWQNIGGDNTTKETAQYTATGWVTDVATPGAINRSGRAVVPPTDTNSTTTATTTTTTTTSQTNTTNTSSKSGSSKKSAASVRIKNTETKMILTPDIQSVGYVNQDIPFTVIAGGNYPSQDNLVRFIWNFGDLHTVEGRTVSHTYSYPGEYVVTVHAKNGKDEQVARHEITILPVSLSITESAEGNIQIHNNAQYDTDISGYIVKGNESVVFPPRTIILARATITIPGHLVGAEALVALYDTKKNLLSSTYNNFVMAPSIVDIETNNNSEVIISRADMTPSSLGFGFRTAAAATIANSQTPEKIIIPAENNQISISTKSDTSIKLWLIGLLSLIFIIVLASGRKQPYLHI